MFNQPVVNGLVLIVGFLAATLIASHAVESRLLRGCAAAVAVASAYGVYLTHTRAVWLAFALVVLIGAVAGRGFRSGFVLTLGVMVLAVASNWSTFTSSDRSAGGVGSASEVHDRLNTIATSIWAFEQKPLMGWGIGRFAAVNTYHHQQYSPEIPWQRGFGISSHLDALGILVELGIIGLAFWIVVLVLIYTRLVRATRQLPAGEMYGRPLGLTALLCLVAQSTTGLTVDLRFFDFPNIIVMLLAGAAIGWQREQARWDCSASCGERCASLVHAAFAGSGGGSSMSSRRALWVSTSMETRGGVGHLRPNHATNSVVGLVGHTPCSHPPQRFRRRSGDRLHHRNRLVHPRAGRPTTCCGSPAHCVLWQFCPQVHPCLDLPLALAFPW